MQALPIESFVCQMHPGNMLSTVIRMISHVRAKWALVYNSIFHMGTDMRIKKAATGSFEGAMGTQ